MSFILDALRKSEAARRRSEAPDLFTAMPEEFAPRRERSAWPMWVIGAVGLIALAVAAWLTLHRAEPDPAVAPSAAVDPAPAALPVPALPAGSPSSTAMPMPGPRPDSQRIAGPAHVANGAPIGNDAVASATPTNRSTPQGIASTDAMPSGATMPARLPEPPPVEVAPAPALRNTPAPASSTSTSQRALRLADLDPGTRKQLPPLKMSMHMWNEDRQRRFVILDGQRLGEGDVIGEVMVEAITQDGAIVNWQGSRLRIEMR